jgi:hypothetical protein
VLLSSQPKHPNRLLSRSRCVESACIQAYSSFIFFLQKLVSGTDKQLLVHYMNELISEKQDARLANQLLATPTLFGEIVCQSGWLDAIESWSYGCKLMNKARQLLFAVNKQLPDSTDCPDHLAAGHLRSTIGLLKPKVCQKLIGGLALVVRLLS